MIKRIVTNVDKMKCERRCFSKKKCMRWDWDQCPILLNDDIENYEKVGEITVEYYAKKVKQ